MAFKQVPAFSADAPRKDGPTVGVAAVHTQDLYVLAILGQLLESAKRGRLKQDCCYVGVKISASRAYNFVVSHCIFSLILALNIYPQAMPARAGGGRHGRSTVASRTKTVPVCGGMQTTRETCDL
jgi:hypothetical protein